MENKNVVTKMIIICRYSSKRYEWEVVHGVGSYLTSRIKEPGSSLYQGARINGSSHITLKRRSSRETCQRPLFHPRHRHPSLWHARRIRSKSLD